MICFRTADAYRSHSTPRTLANCTAQSGINVNMANFYMLHVWVLDYLKVFEPDVYAGMMP